MSTKTQELNICMELCNKYPATKEFMRKDRTYKISKQKHILDIITEQSDINKFMEFAQLYCVRRPHKNSPPPSPPQQSANGNVVLAIDIKDDDEIKKLKKQIEKLNTKLDWSVKVNEELRKENDNIMPELEAKNMLQSQEINKLKEENKMMDEFYGKEMEELRTQISYLKKECLAYNPSEAERLKHNVDYYVKLHKDACDTHIKTNEKFRKEIASLEETIQTQTKNLHKFMKLLRKNKIKW